MTDPAAPPGWRWSVERPTGDEVARQHRNEVDSFVSQHLCYCGDPPAALDLIRDLMTAERELAAARHETDFGDLEGFEARHAAYRAKVEAAMAVPLAAETLIWYLLDDLGLMEHGNVIPGWLTPGGEALLDALNATRQPDGDYPLGVDDD